MRDMEELQVRIVKVDYPFGSEGDTLEQRGFTIGQVVTATANYSIRGDIMFFNHIYPDGQNCAMHPCEVEIVEE